MRLALRQLATAAVLGAAALAGSSAASADTAPLCVETGVLAVQGTPADVPSATGPSIAGPTRSGTTTTTVTDDPTGLHADSVTLGVAGCVDDAGTPGGTTARATHWSILGGAVSGTALRADLVPAVGDGAGWHLRAVVSGLRVDGRAVTLAPGESTDVGDWGVLRAQATLEKAAPGGVRWWRSALRLQLTSAHAGFAAGTTFLIGWAVADREPLTLPPLVAKPPATTAKVAPKRPSAPTPRKAPAAKPKAPPARTPSTKVRATKKKTVKKAVGRRGTRTKPRRAKPTAPQPLRGTPPLQAGPFTFPVAGDVAFGDTYGAARSDVSDGWHHGDDLFAPLGTPVVAVTDGTVFSVGWNRIGGWRLWLLDSAGDEFYYAHLSGYTALGANGRHVRRGDVLGYVGNTGDAVTTDTHLHFEIHPSPLLYLGYDGAVDPTTYLDHWARPSNVHTLPPVPLPGRAPSGWGAVTDFRRLLALRPMHRHVAATRAASAKTLGPSSLSGVTGPGVLALERRAVAPLYRAAPAKAGGDGTAAAIAGLLLVAGALVALLYTVRSARD